VKYLLIILIITIISCKTSKTQTTVISSPDSNDNTGVLSGSTSGPPYHHPVPQPPPPPTNEIPEFPTHPPKPSTTDILSKSYFSGSKTVGDVNVKLSNALEECHYFRRSYFHVPNGFALATQLEQINEDGTCLPDNQRWTDDKPKEKFSLANYLSALLNASPGYYRCIVFIVSDNYYRLSQTPATKSQTDEWIDSGLNRLPPEISKLPLNDNYSFDALIYEFKKNKNDKQANLIKSPVPGRTHLINSKIIATLNR
jgi:hypothetical protein